jgi:hypothetical protein
MADQDDIGMHVAQLRNAVERLEHRLAGVERILDIHSYSQEDDASEDRSVRSEEDDLALEFRLGELWVGHLGVVVLLVGIAFLISYPFGLHGAFQGLIGYVSVGIGVWVSRKWESAYPSIARTIFIGGLMLFYFTTLRLHFFASAPLIPQKSIGLVLVVLSVVYVFYLAAARRSQVLSGLAVVLAMATSLATDTTHVALMVITGATAVSVWFRLRYGWVNSVLFTLCAMYVTFLIWLLNNPFGGHPLQIVSEHHGSLVYLFVCAFLLGGANLPKRETTDADVNNVALTLFNGAGFYVLGMMIAYAHFRPHFSFVNVLFSIFFLALSTAYWLYRESRFSTAFYACFGYVALSVGILAHFELSEGFVWLGWQSLLVISTAIWYRSKIVVVANVFIYLGILAFYLLFTEPNLIVNLSYALVALLSARIMNWQKERLTLQTELLRNVYLASAFVVIPYGLHHGVAANYVSVSWLGAALFFFALSLTLKNSKYRWMAILMLFLTVGRVFLVDLASLNPAFRIVSFMVVGATMLGVSWMYARSREKTADTR